MSFTPPKKKKKKCQTLTFEKKKKMQHVVVLAKWIEFPTITWHDTRTWGSYSQTTHLISLSLSLSKMQLLHAPSSPYLSLLSSKSQPKAGKLYCFGQSFIYSLWSLCIKLLTFFLSIVVTCSTSFTRELSPSSASKTRKVHMGIGQTLHFEFCFY